MRDLRLDADQVRSWFNVDDEDASIATVVRVARETADRWLEHLVDGVRRCYVTDEFVEARAAETGLPPADLVAAVLPDRGPVMSGDFGEILVFLYLANDAHPAEVIGPKKWRLKQDRRKAAPYSDVVQFIVPDWPESSERDRVICAEVKTKATDGNTTPISAAIEDSERDQLGRLAKTLPWLKERAMVQDLGSTTIELIQRFQDATDHPPASKTFWAIAVVCEDLVAAELLDVPAAGPAGCSVAVISVPDLKAQYEELFDAVARSLDDK